MIAFSGISNALYGGGQPEQASSSQEPKKEVAEPAPPETTMEATTSPETTAETAASPKLDKESTQEEDKSNQSRHDATTKVTRVVDGDTVKISPALEGND